MQVVDEWAARGEHLATADGRVWFADTGVPDGASGDDPAVFVVHGFPASSFDWRHVLDRVAERHRVVVFDCFGFGLSDKPDRRYSIELQADAAEAVIAHLGLERIRLVSHDMGDTVAGELLARDLEGGLDVAVVTRVLTNGSIYIEMAQLTLGQQFLLALPDEKVEAGPDGDGFKAGIAATFAAEHQPSAEELDAQWALMSRHDGHTLLPRSIRYIEDRRAREERYTGAIETHPAPLGVVWGRLDPVAVAAMAERLAAARPDVDLRWLDDVGHWPMIEAPGRFGDALMDLLDREGDAG